MAMQAIGMSFSKIVLLSGAAYTASIMATNGQLAVILGRLQVMGISLAAGLVLGYIAILCITRRGQLIWEVVVDELMSARMANAKQFRIGNSCFADVLDSLPGSSLKDISGNYTMRSFYLEVVKLLNSNRSKGVAQSLNKDCVPENGTIIGRLNVLGLRPIYICVLTKQSGSETELATEFRDSVAIPSLIFEE
ncbi:hypothetical protein Syun_026028 [Stephania yunnanensis]|uniref:Uncharacterized protein n=1 Tax=Stephania yunnanensis TaxID=152371 RepID=A0AAP0HRU0_9MAGN